MDRITVRPGEGRHVRLPDGRRLTPETTPAEGVSTPWSLYLHRRLECGDLVIVPPPAPAAPPAPKPDGPKTGDRT